MTRPPRRSRRPSCSSRWRSSAGTRTGGCSDTSSGGSGSSSPFGLAYWELDSGGPVARALSSEPRKPDFQFPQDENRELARPSWEPRLWDYVYVSLTNSIAFSPTDSMPLTRDAKRLMAVEAGLSGVTILLVAARAVNILR